MLLMWIRTFIKQANELKIIILTSGVTSILFIYNAAKLIHEIG